MKKPLWLSSLLERSRTGLCAASRMASTSIGALCLLALPLATGPAHGQTAASAARSAQLPADWRDVKDGVGGYPAGPMLEIAVRHTPGDKLEMFKWRSQFIAMLSAQPGPLVEREWKSVAGFPANAGAGTWTGMTWWENQQKWHDMANLLFPTQVAANWMKTLEMTLIFVKPRDAGFDLHTLAQSGTQVLEVGVLAFPTSGANVAAADDEPAAAQHYLDALRASGVETYRFAIYRNPAGLIGPFTAAYNKNGPPDATGEKWYVYMAAYDSMDARSRLQSTDKVRRAFDLLGKAVVAAHSDIQVMTRSTSQVCIKGKTNSYSLDPDDCHVGVMGSGDTWAGSYGERPQPCITDYDVQTLLPPKTCIAVGGRRVDDRTVPAHP